MTQTRSDDAAPRSLRPDCVNCFGLCCVAPVFVVSADFAIDKPAGQPCPNLQRDFRCAIHAGLRRQGFPGCAAYDCFGAGQRVSQETFGGQDRRHHPATARQMFAVFDIMRQLHELLWLLGEAERMVTNEALLAELEQAQEATDQLASGSPRDLVVLDIEAHRRDCNQFLLQASEAARSAHGGLGPDYRGARLVGGDLRRRALANASLRGAVLVGANLEGLDLGAADLTGRTSGGRTCGGPSSPGASSSRRLRSIAPWGVSGRSCLPGVGSPPTGLDTWREARAQLVAKPAADSREMVLRQGVGGDGSVVA